MGQYLNLDATALICETLEDETEKTTWLKQQGFQPAMRYPRCTLTVADFDLFTYSEDKGRN